MRRCNQGGMNRLCLIVLAWLGVVGAFGATPKKAPEPVVLVVLDPLAKELACACVKGYGQRDYRKLAARPDEETAALLRAVRQRAAS